MSRFIKNKKLCKKNQKEKESVLAPGPELEKQKKIKPYEPPLY